MNQLCKYAAVGVTVVLSLILSRPAMAQSFNKGVLLLSLSEGGTHATYSTTSPNDGGNHIRTDGDRDPITLEYGLSKHWGIGLNMGTDILKVDPSAFYGFHTSTGNVHVFMSEITVDASYHFFVTRHTDLCAFTSVGVSGVTIKGNDGDFAYQYNAGGGIIRVGSKIKYYPRHRLGFMAMLSAYSANCSPKGVEGNTVGNNYTTSIKGWAIEFGPCFRFF